MDPLTAAALGSVATGLFNQRSANKQMRFQDVSSRTQYQRAVADMKAAGLNPMLATKLGGNAAMSGASATMPDLGATINSAENLRQMKPVREAETLLKKTQQEVANMSVYELDARIDKIEQEARNLGIDADIKRLDREAKQFVVAIDRALYEKDPSVYIANKTPIMNTMITAAQTGVVSIGELLEMAYEKAAAAGKEAAPKIRQGIDKILQILGR
jgi:ribosomal protein L13E